MTTNSNNTCDVAVIGAGPYGLSVAAHLKHAGLSPKVFGRPMSFWREQMPKGMLLRSPRIASNISNPDGLFSLESYVVQKTDDQMVPVEQFVAYGTWFQERVVPDLDRRTVQQIDRTSSNFRLMLTDGEAIEAKRVVVAAGLANQDYRPDVFHGLPAEYVTHSSEHTDFAPFRGRHVAVIGRGQSACESAALLTESGANVELISRGEIRWLGLPAADAGVIKRAKKLWLDALEAPSAVGPFPLSWLVEFPSLAHNLPFDVRQKFSQRCLKAAASGWLKPRFDAVMCLPDRVIQGARIGAGRVALELDNGTRSYDHVVLGTGYKIDISRIGFLSPQLMSAIALVDGSPVLHRGLESSVPGLHFVGSAAVKSFGPLMRFVAGAPYAASAVTNAARGDRVRGTSKPFAGALTPKLSSRS